MQKSKINKKQIAEIECVKKFLTNANIGFKEEDIKLSQNENDIIDVFWKDKKFQITFADPEFQKLINITQKDECGVRWIKRLRNPKEVLNDFFIRPIQNKSKYGRSAEGVILLIDSYTYPPFLEKQIINIRELNQDNLKNLNFKEIYIVCPGKNIQVYL